MLHFAMHRAPVFDYRCKRREMKLVRDVHIHKLVRMPVAWPDSSLLFVPFFFTCAWQFATRGTLLSKRIREHFNDKVDN